MVETKERDFTIRLDVALAADLARAATLTGIQTKTELFRLALRSLVEEWEAKTKRGAGR